MGKIWYVTAAVILFLCAVSFGFEFTTDFSCDSLDPFEMRHESQISTPPYTMTVDPSVFELNAENMITVTYTQPTAIRNVMITTICTSCQQPMMAIGRFSAVPNYPSDLLDCAGTATAIATADNELKTQYLASWTPLSAATGKNFYFVATVVADRTKWWKNITSSVVGQAQSILEISTSAPTSEPASETTSEPASEPTSEPASEPTSEPASEPTSEPASEPTSEPASEATSEPDSEPATEPSTAVGNRRHENYLLGVCSCNGARSILRHGVMFMYLSTFIDFILIL